MDVTLQFKNGNYCRYLNKFMLVMKIAVLLFSVAIMQASASVIKPKIKSNKLNKSNNAWLEKVKGKVVDEAGLPLPGVTVTEKGTKNTVMTDPNGEFIIDVNNNSAILVISYIGYQSKEVSATSASAASIALVASQENLNEVVVTAYGKVKKATLTDAISTIDSKRLESRPLRTLADGLVGLAPGLNIRMPSGAPETAPTINVRGFTGFGGSGAPLVLIDGVERPMQDVNPDDIETISLLKDGASTVIYGSRAPYGVLLITTKSGKTGKASVNYSNNIRIGKMVLFPTQPESPEWARYINMAQRNGQPAGTGTDGVDAITIARMEAWLKQDWNNAAFDELRTRFGAQAQSYIENGQFPTADASFKYWTREQSFATTKLYDVYMNQSDVSQQHNLSINGGTDRLQYYTSVGYNDGKGLFKGDFNYNRRQNFQTKLNYKAADWLDLRTDVSIVRQENQGANYRGGVATDNSTNSNVANYGDIFGSMTQYFATPLKVPSGNAYSWILGASGILGEGGLIKNRRNDVVLTGGATVRPFKYFEVNGDYTLRLSNSLYSRTEKVAYTEWPDGTKVQNNRSVNLSSLAKSTSFTNYQFAKLSGQYKRTIANDHNILAQIGVQMEDNSFESLTGSKTDLYAPNEVEALRFAANNPAADDNLYQWATLGYYGVLSYDFREKYSVKFAARTDASSRFTPQARWGFFPSVSGAWNIAKEELWPLKNWISELKPRVSWSTSGDLASIGANTYYSVPILNASVSRTTLLGGNYSNVFTPPGLISATQTWAKPTMLDFGIDLTALKQRLNLTFDWYQRTIKDQVGPPDPVSKVLGTGAPDQNNSVSETRGWELSLGWNDKFNVASKPFTYDIRLNMSDYIGYVVKYSSNSSGTRSGAWTPGELFGQNFLYKGDGIAQNTSDLDGRTLNGTYNYPGYLQYKDLNGDGYINSGNGGFWYSLGDLVKDGFNYPRKSYSILPSVSWNNISLSAVLDGVMQWKIYSSSLYVWGTNSGSGIAYFGTPVFKESSDLGYWNTDKRDAFFPALNTGSALATDRYALNLAHLRVRNVTLGYDLPKQWISKAKLNRVNVYFSGENLGFIYAKSFIKYDPDFLSNLSGLFSNGVSGYPPLRYYSFGIKIGL
jgi:TonB-linked SusC/RagA family outer membrane protein